VFRALVLFTFGGCALACAPAGPTSPRALAAPRVPESQPSTKPAAALATACHAEPSTVYGDEPVVFEIQGPAQPGLVTLQLWDEQGRVILQDRAPVPGPWHPTGRGLESGDFRLEVGSTGVNCFVTVNRELARASEPAR
jgi:hypothetical protein